MNDATIDIPALIVEAQKLGVNIHDHVATKVYGECNAATRYQAKQLTFIHLYGGKAFVTPARQEGKTFVQEHMNEPWTPEDKKVVDAFCKKYPGMARVIDDTILVDHHEAARNLFGDTDES
jgi:hypothetical protein